MTEFDPAAQKHTDDGDRRIDLRTDPDTAGWRDVYRAMDVPLPDGDGDLDDNPNPGQGAGQ